MRQHRPRVAALLLSCVLGGCIGSTSSPAPTVPFVVHGDAPPEPASSVPFGGVGDALPSPSSGSGVPSESPEASPPAGPETALPDGSAAPEPVAPPTPRADAGIAPGDVLAVIVDGLRVRSQPRVANDSEKLTPLLTRTRRVYVYDGPVKASGYTWFRVLPFERRYPEGWIAIASRDGEPWVKEDRSGCDAIGPSVTVLQGLTPGQALGCYGATPLKLDARIVSCRTEVDAPPISPAWFGYQNVKVENGRICPALIEPGARDVDPGNLFWAHFDPAGRIPDPLPIDQHVVITGQYDHPAAAKCRSDLIEDPVLVCRTTFVITRVKRAT